MVFGLFLAYKSRNVKYIYINDSRFVSITMYIVVILVGIGAPLSLVLAVHLFHDTAYALTVLMIIAACMSCLLILYIPKVCVCVCMSILNTLYKTAYISTCFLALSLCTWQKAKRRWFVKILERRSPSLMVFNLGGQLCIRLM